MVEVNQVRLANNLLRALESTFSTVKDAETGHRGYQLTRDTTFLVPYNLAVKSIVKNIKTLDSLVSEDLEQRERVDTLQVLINKQFIIISSILANTAKTNLYMDEYEMSLLLRGKENMNQIREMVKEIEDAQMEIYSKKIESEIGFQEIAPISILVYSLLAIGACVVLFNRTLGALRKKDKAEKEILSSNESLREEVELRKFTQTLLRNVIDNSLNGIMAFKAIRNDEGKIIDFEWILSNNEGYKLAGKEGHDLIGKRLLTEMPGHAEEGLFTMYKDVVEQGEALIIEKLYSSDGLNNWFHIEAVKLEDGYICTFSDITENKLKAKQLLQANEDLKRSNTDLEQFAYVASHDLQEPLRKIRAFGDLLANEKVVSDDARDYIQRMQTAALRMQTLIEDLLAFSRVSRSSEIFESIQLKSILKEVLEDIGHQIKREEATVTLEDLDIEINGDKTQIKRLFQNLISNAIKFHKKSELPMVRIYSEVLTGQAIAALPEHRSDIGYVKITVEDNGIGFEPQYTEKIFSIFQRLHGRTEYDGTGIGLAICRKIAANHNGYIWAESQRQIGSKFIVILQRGEKV